VTTCPRCQGPVHIEYDEIAQEDDYVCLACGWRAPVRPREPLGGKGGKTQPRLSRRLETVLCR
jgi:DNA-directed RNA polymerase subunit RPC12/RpoP